MTLRVLSSACVNKCASFTYDVDKTKRPTQGDLAPHDITVD